MKDINQAVQQQLNSLQNRPKKKPGVAFSSSKPAEASNETATASIKSSLQRKPTALKISSQPASEVTSDH